MNKAIKIIIGIVVAGVIIGGGYAWHKGSGANETIKIGFVGPLTGDAAVYGQEEKNVIALALSEINNTGGINGRKLEVIYEDGKCNGKDAATVAQKLITVDKVKVILGGLCSGETLAMTPIAEQNKVIVFSAFSSNPSITTAGDYIFRNSPSDADVAKGYADYMINKAGYKNIAVLAENTDGAIGSKDIFVEEVKRLGGTVAIDEVFKQGERDFRANIIKIKNANPQAIFINPQAGPTGGTAIRQIREAGIKTPIFTTFAVGGEDGVKAAGSASEGVIFFDAIGLSGDQGKALLEKYTSIYGKIAGNSFGVGARYDTVNIITNALKKCGEDTECIKDYLYKMDSYTGTIGTYAFDANGDVAGIEPLIPKIIRNGKAEELK